DPIEEISGPPGGFSSLADSSVAVDNSSGELYVTDDIQPAHTESPQALIDGFGPTGAYDGHLKYAAIDASPPGLAVDNTPPSTQGRVSVTPGTPHPAGVSASAPGSLVKPPPLAPAVPPPPLGGGELFPTVAIGAAAGGSGCEGDACQILPPPPSDPTLTT